MDAFKVKIVHLGRPIEYSIQANDWRNLIFFFNGGTSSNGNEKEMIKNVFFRGLFKNN